MSHALNPLSRDIEAMIARIETALRDDGPFAVDPDTVQNLMGLACRVYGAQVLKGETYLPVGGHNAITADDALYAASGLLEARRHFPLRIRHVEEPHGPLNDRNTPMHLVSDNDRVVSVEELNTSRLLRNARKQADLRKFDDMLIVDVDAHHYESENFKDIIPFMENEVYRQLSLAQVAKSGRGVVNTVNFGFQDVGGRVTRYPLRASERTTPGRTRDIEIGERWMDAMSVDYSCLFPTGMLNIGLHPSKDMEVELCWAYNRWVTEKALPESGGRMYSMLSLPFSSPEASLKQVEAFGHRKGVGGFMITTVRDNMPVYDDAYMKVYRAIEERGLALSFHSGFNWGKSGVFQSCNRFIAAHALGFSWYNILHLTNWVVNGLCERFPKLPVIWIEAGLAWVPFLMQRLDHEFMIRSSECPLLKKKPSDYMRDMYYSTQPMEIQDMEALETTFRMINAETQLLYSSDYPHWDFDLPSTISDLPFLSEKAKHNILGGNAARLFKLPPRNEKQRENLVKYGNLVAEAAE